jgi:hypothetical protein
MGRNQEEEMLSSRLTWHYRYTVPNLLTVIAVAVIWRYLSKFEVATGKELLLSILLVAACVIYSRFLDRAKWVSIRDDSLIIADRKRKVEIDFNSIADIRTTVFLRPTRVRVIFKRATIFGEEIFFFPPLNIFESPAANSTALKLQLRAAQSGHKNDKASVAKAGKEDRGAE